jgi:hypothetical protein
MGELDVLGDVLILDSSCSKLLLSFYSSIRLWAPMLNLRVDL